MIIITRVKNKIIKENKTHTLKKIFYDYYYN